MQRLSLLIYSALLIMMFSGCGTSRYYSTLPPSGEKDLNIGAARFSLVDLNFKYTRTGTPIDKYSEWMEKKDYDARARALYPKVFSDDFTALPVLVEVNASYDDSSLQRAAMFTGLLTLGVIPFPGTASRGFAVQTDVLDAGGEFLARDKKEFEFNQVMSMSVIGPLGLIPFPGKSDLPRDGLILLIPFNDAYSLTKHQDYIVDCIIEAVVHVLRTVDIARLDNAYQARRARLKEFNIGGRQYWTFLVPSFSKGFKNQERADLFNVLLYKDLPKRSVAPLESVTVAWRDEDGRWQPTTGYLRTASVLTRVKTLIENGCPARIVIDTPASPPLEDFINLPGGIITASDLRWSNGILLEAKNKTLPSLLQEKSADELIALTTRIEKNILSLNEASERAKDRAQQIVEKGNGDPGPDRGMSILFRQRIEVLKPILRAIKMRIAAMG